MKTFIAAALLSLSSIFILIFISFGFATQTSLNPDAVCENSPLFEYSLKMTIQELDNPGNIIPKIQENQNQTDKTQGQCQRPSKIIIAQPTLDATCYTCVTCTTCYTCGVTCDTCVTCITHCYTCPDPTCSPTSCGYTCDHTCSNTCIGATCDTTCSGATCDTTCSGDTCDTTCNKKFNPAVPLLLLDD